ncbi:hypothetical protein MKY96_32450 [Paenibacillus sp. FSL R7-0302]|uniref:hypothetical protein n=1 Tax=Paenibacillus sp. FSL R7-0302 TaxID=2921681 RepID=UPI0030F76C2B
MTDKKVFKVIKIEITEEKYYKSPGSNYFNIPLNYTLEDGRKMILPCSNQRLKDAKETAARLVSATGHVGRYIEDIGGGMVSHIYRHSEWIEFMRVQEVCKLFQVKYDQAESTVTVFDVTGTEVLTIDSDLEGVPTWVLQDQGYLKEFIWDRHRATIINKQAKGI